MHQPPEAEHGGSLLLLQRKRERVPLAARVKQHATTRLGGPIRLGKGALQVARQPRAGARAPRRSRSAQRRSSASRLAYQTCIARRPRITSTAQLLRWRLQARPGGRQPPCCAFLSRMRAPTTFASPGMRRTQQAPGPAPGRRRTSRLRRPTPQTRPSCLRARRPARRSAGARRRRCIAAARLHRAQWCLFGLSAPRLRPAHEATVSITPRCSGGAMQRTPSSWDMCCSEVAASSTEAERRRVNARPRDAARSERTHPACRC